MIAAWMMYCTVIGMMLAAAAHLTEHLVLGRGGATRRIWLVAMLVAVTLPAFALLAEGDPSAPVAAALGLSLSPGTLAITRGVDLLSGLDAFLLRGWIASSAGLALVLGASLVAVARCRRSWTREEVDGVPVLVSDDMGPAVVGIVRTRIVLPRWAVAEDAVRRALLLKHEQEHVAAGDSRLIFLAALLVVAMPWNLAVWRMALRLRTAVETDCDRRVMGCAGVDARSYGALLLSVGRRRSARPALAAVGFSRSRSLLATRIDRMTLRRRRGALRTVATVVAAAALVAAAWAVPQPVRADAGAAGTTCPDATGPSGAVPGWTA